jgi:isopentenyl-diphosphate delta-isomerase
MSATQTTTQAAGSIVADVSLDGYDEEQVRLMEERCILVDENDKAYGEGSKKQCEC